MAFQHVSENEESAYAFTVEKQPQQQKNQTTQQHQKTQKNKKQTPVNSYTLLFCSAFLTLFATYFCITMMTRINCPKITISVMWASFRQHSVNRS